MLAPLDATHSDPRRLAFNAQWLAKLRWVAVAGQLATIAIVAGPLGAPLPLACLLGLVATTAVTNLGFALWLRWQRDAPAPLPEHVWHAVLGGLMVLDLFVLTVMLARTGGPTNPFAIYYFVNLALCGVLLPGRWAWLLDAVAIVAFATITCWHTPLPVLRDPQRLLSVSERGGAHVVEVGALVAFAACATVIVSFATRLTRELREMQDARSRAEARRARSEKLEALGTLAAGAAHELASPLSTIAVVAKELENELAGCQVTPDVQADVRLIRGELARCRAILDRMSGGAGRAAGEAPVVVRGAELVATVVEGLGEGAGQVEVEVAPRAAAAAVLAPPTALAQALRALVKNALDAAPETPARVGVDAHEGWLTLTVRDAGPGVAPDVLARMGEPFFTTKEPGQGMGLGVFLARSVIERIGGALRIESPRGAGAVVTVRLPVASAPDPSGGKEPVDALRPEHAALG